MPSFEESYLGQLRKEVGHRKLFLPGATAIIRNNQGHLLLIRRRDNGRWALPAGAMELEESVHDALVREVREESGLEVISATLLAIHSEPRFTFTNMYGDTYQMLSFLFRVDDWRGTLVTSTDETIDARFFSPEGMPEISWLTHETLEELKNFNGQVILK